MDDLPPCPKGCPVIVVRKRGLMKPYKLAYHPEIEIQYIKQGSGGFFIGGQNYSFGKNTLLCIPPNEIHNFNPDARSTIEKCHVIFPLSWIGDPDRPAKYPSKQICRMDLPEKESLYVDFLFRQIENEIDQKELSWEEVVREDLRILMLLMRRAAMRTKRPHKEHPVAAQLMDYLEVNFKQSLNLPFLAKTFGYSDDYLSRLCKQHTGLGLKQYILQRRIIEARRLLEREPELTVAAVAERVGFEDFGVFNRDFKMITGLTAAAYRGISHPQDRK